MKQNLLIGAISGNYTLSDIKLWLETSRNIPNLHRVLLLYNPNIQLESYKEDNLEIITCNTNFWNEYQPVFETDTSRCNVETSYNLVHNIRFFHISEYLNRHWVKFNKVLITDVKDVMFNGDPFKMMIYDKIIATSECIFYEDHQWNKEHLIYNLGKLGYDLLEEQVLNVGVFGGPAELIHNLCSDIYLMSIGKPKVADQTSFNYLIRNNYDAEILDIDDKFAIHLHVINEGHVKFDLKNIKNYKIIHQYDRIPGFLQYYNSL